MTNHYNPKKSAIVERFKFNKCNRKPSQAISAYVADLEELSRTCKFGETADGVTFTSQLILVENLRDRCVCGLKDTIIQRRLLSEDNLSYEKVVKIANAMELASAGVNARGRFSDHKLLVVEMIRFSYFTFRYLYIIIFICQGDSRMSRYFSENVTILLIIFQVIDIIYDQNYRYLLYTDNLIL